MIKKTLLLIIAGFCTTIRTEPTQNLYAATQTPQTTVRQAHSLAQFVLRHAQEKCGDENVEAFLTAAQDTKEYVCKHPYFSGSLLTIAAGPKRIVRGITFPVRLAAKTATTAIVIAATTMVVMHHEKIALWTQEQIESAKTVFANIKEQADMPAITDAQERSLEDLTV